MDPAAAVITGAIIGASASVLAGAIIPLLADTLRRRSEANRVRMTAVKEIAPRLLELATDTLQLPASGATSAPPTPSEVRLMADLNMTAGKSEREVVMILTMCMTAARGSDRKSAERHILAALTMLGEWARNPRARDLYRKYAHLISVGDAAP